MYPDRAASSYSFSSRKSSTYALCGTNLPPFEPSAGTPGFAESAEGVLPANFPGPANLASKIFHGKPSSLERPRFPRSSRAIASRLCLETSVHSHRVRTIPHPLEPSCYLHRGSHLPSSPFDPPSSPPVLQPGPTCHRRGGCTAAGSARTIKQIGIDRASGISGCGH